MATPMCSQTLLYGSVRESEIRVFLMIFAENIEFNALLANGVISRLRGNYDMS